MENEIQVYGADWCGLTFAVRKHLTNARIPYDYYNVDRDVQADEFITNLGDGHRRFPLVVVGVRILTSPTLGQLQQALNEERLLPVSQ